MSPNNSKIRNHRQSNHSIMIIDQHNIRPIGPFPHLKKKEFVSTKIFQSRDYIKVG